VNFALPHIEKFMPLWSCFALVLAAIAAFVALLIVLVASSGRREEDRK